MTRLYTLSFIVFLLSGLFTSSHAENSFVISEDSYQGHIQIFGHVGFLMRLTQKQAFSVSVHNHVNQQCRISDELLRAPLLSELKLSDYPTASTAPFTLHLELIGGMDPHKTCLVSYDLSLLRNYSGHTDGQEEVQNSYDYIHAVPLLEVKGLMHIRPDTTEQKLVEGVQIAGKRLLYNLGQIQKIYALPQKR
ncbi:hypothetical protein GCM10011332_08070 [Terasakiella brassicae]|uniref:Uncharacterized protein n=1 Tax=Terasakiella brassicae TaxID=1634917 RepID=A0A917F8Q3_9PROT|nr:hypothetical protein [Terasakiella brassicae]GGF57020.1 hypothetical protein GCM10011332_08070 [Terasakiella brassicae]